MTSFHGSFVLDFSIIARPAQLSRTFTVNIIKFFVLKKLLQGCHAFLNYEGI
jgi:hypothetical protein